MITVHPDFFHGLQDPEAETTARKDTREGWILCPALGYTIHPSACTGRKESHANDPSRNLCLKDCGYLQVELPKTPEYFSPREPNPFKGAGHRKDYICAGLPWESCTTAVGKPGGRCARHGQLWARSRGARVGWKSESRGLSEVEEGFLGAF